MKMRPLYNLFVPSNTTIQKMTVSYLFLQEDFSHENCHFHEKSDFKIKIRPKYDHFRQKGRMYNLGRINMTHLITIEK